MKKYVTASIFKKRYADVFKGDTNWRKIKTVESETYRWNMSSTYVQNPPYFEGMKKSRNRSSMWSMRVFWRCSATRSPPTTSRRPARSS